MAALLLFALTFSVHGAPRPYHLELEVYPAAPFPSLSRFGTVTVHAYPGGVRADSFWLSGFSTARSNSVTVINPLMRMYTSIPMSEVTAIIGKATLDRVEAGEPPVTGPTKGRVGAVHASRYRLVYGPNAWIDVWTTRDIPDNPQLRAVIDSVVTGISAPAAKAARAIPGTPVYIELNFRRFKKVPFLKLKQVTWNSSGEAEAMRVGSYYMKAPLLDAIWR